MTMNRSLHLALHGIGACLAVYFIWVCIQNTPTDGLSPVAPWACLATHVLGAFTHRPESQPNRDTEFLGIIRVSLAVVACLISAGQHWVTGVVGIELVALAASSLLLEVVRPARIK